MYQYHLLQFCLSIFNECCQQCSWKEDNYSMNLHCLYEVDLVSLVHVCAMMQDLFVMLVVCDVGCL